MADQELFGQTYHIDDFDCKDHGEAAEEVVRQVLGAKDEFEGKLPSSWAKVAVCQSGRHNIIARLEGNRVLSFDTETREHPMPHSNRIR